MGGKVSCEANKYSKQSVLGAMMDGKRNILWCFKKIIFVSCSGNGFELTFEKNISDRRINNVSITIMREDEKVIVQEELERS